MGIGLEIEFLDGPPTMLVGHTAEVRVNQQDANGAKTQIAITDVSFEFRPNAWGRVSPSSDPAIGTLEVIELVETDDPLLEPHYAIHATLNRSGAQAIAPQRKIRLLPTALEIELALEIGVVGSYRRFALSELSQPVDWTLARVTSPETQSIVVRDGVPYLRLTGLDALPAKLEITFPNGEVASLVVEGQLSARGLRETARITVPDVPTPVPTIEAARAPIPVAVPEEAPAEAPAAAAPEDVQSDADGVGLRGDLVRLRRYVASFAGSMGSADEEREQRIRERIGLRVDELRGTVEAYSGADREELVAQFEDLCREAHPASA
jgi:hypothetical protein